MTSSCDDVVGYLGGIKESWSLLAVNSSLPRGRERANGLRMGDLLSGASGQGPGLSSPCRAHHGAGAGGERTRTLVAFLKALATRSSDTALEGSHRISHSVEWVTE